MKATVRQRGRGYLALCRVGDCRECGFHRCAFCKRWFCGEHFLRHEGWGCASRPTPKRGKWNYPRK